MSAAHQLVVGWAVAHAALLWYWFCGSIALRPARSRQTSSAALLDVVLSCVTGMAITAFVTFGLGLIHAITRVSAVAVVGGLLIAFALCGDSPLRRQFWQARFTQLRTAALPGALIVYMLALFLSVPALYPDNGSDATFFYLPQALEYARSHYLIVDTWTRYPWYPQNWALTLTWPFVFGLDYWMGFFNWIASLLTLLGVYGLVAYNDDREGSRAVRVSWIGLGAALTLAAQPIFTRFGVLNMIDIPSGMLFLTCVLACIVAVRERSRRVLAALVCCAGFLIGTKVSYPALGPLLLGLILIALRSAASPRRVAAFALAAFVVLASPWYVRSFVLSGDPIEPVLNLKFQGADPKISRSDLRGQLADLQSDNRPQTLLTLPYVMWAAPASRESRDIGVTLLVLCLPLPAIYLGWAFLARRGTPRPMLIAATAIVYGYAYWNLTSHLERYSLIFMPLLAAFTGMLAAAIARRRRLFGYPVFAALLVLAIPSHDGVVYDDQIWDQAYKNVGVYYTTRNLWLEYRGPAYPQFEDIAHLLRRAKALDKRVYVVELGGNTFVAQEFGMVQIGDAFGLGRFGDLGRAVLRGVLGPWLARFNVGVLVVAQSTLDGDSKYAGLEQAMEAIGWRRYRYAHSDWVVFESPRLPPLVVGEGHPADAGPEGAATPATWPGPREEF